MNPDTMEAELVVSAFVNSPGYNFESLLSEVAKNVQEQVETPK
jgi:hypothetical protein